MKSLKKRVQQLEDRLKVPADRLNPNERARFKELAAKPVLTEEEEDELMLLRLKGSGESWVNAIYPEEFLKQTNGRR